jgi:hypothetical protein
VFFLLPLLVLSYLYIRMGLSLYQAAASGLASWSNQNSPVRNLRRINSRTLALFIYYSLYFEFS